MKFSPIVSLALVLAAGMATAAVAQTTTSTPSEPKSSVTEPKATVAKPQTGPIQSQPGLTDKKATSTTEMKTIEPKAKSAEMKATHPRAKRIAHLKATHPKRMAQMKGTDTKPIRTAHLRHPIMQTERLSPDQVKATQLQLQAAGLYNGPTDGMMDPDTRAALARFQQQNGLQRTNRLDPQTLARLNANQTTGFGSSAAPSGNQTPAPASAGGNTTVPVQPSTR